MTTFQQIGWNPSGSVRILDQTRLPADEVYLDLETVEEAAEAIRSLRVRGAPLIGVAAAMAGTLVTRRLGGSVAGKLEEFLRGCDVLEATRPTAVNLAWALEQMRTRARAAAGADQDLHQALVAEANAIWEEDQRMCERIGAAGLPLVVDGATIHTHCNAGALATGGMGTALAPVYLAHREGRRVSVVADETRPLMQGSRLTAWELGRTGIPCTVIADNMAASRLGRRDITCVIVGADRIAANGDVANKIGTYGLALAARAHSVPFYVAAPTSTFDFATLHGRDIPIEQRSADEVRNVQGHTIAAPTAEVWNPAFDVTPAELVTAYITDRGLLGRDELDGLRTEG